MHSVGSAISAQNAKARAASIEQTSAEMRLAWSTVSEALSEYMEYHLDCETDEWHDLDADFTKFDKWLSGLASTYQLPHCFEISPSNESHTLTCNGYFVFNGTLTECFIAFGGHLAGLGK